MPTANDPIDPALVLADLERYKKRVAQAVATEEELDRARRAEHLRLSREISALEQRDAALADEVLAELNAAHAMASYRERVCYEARKVRVNQAFHASRASLAQRLQREKDERVGDAHGSVVMERQRLRQELEEETAVHKSLKKVLLEDHQVRVDLRAAALAALRSFRPLVAPRFSGKTEVAGPSEGWSPDRLRGISLTDVEAAREAVEAIRGLPLAKFFRFAPPWVLSLLLGGGTFAVTRQLGPAVLGAAALPYVAWLVALAQAWPLVARAGDALARSLRSARSAEAVSAAGVKELEAGIAELEKGHSAGLHRTFHETGADLQTRIEEGQRELQRQLMRLPDRIQDLHRRRMGKIEKAHEEAVSRARETAEGLAAERARARREVTATTNAAMDDGLARLDAGWKCDVTGNQARLEELEAASVATYPLWTAENTSAWKAAEEAPGAVRIGSVRVEAEKLPGGLPRSPLLALAGAMDFKIPLALGFPGRGSLLIESEGESAEPNAVLNAISIRILASLPPGRASFVFIDPVGLGRDFAGLMHLADYEESLINHRIWTGATQIEERLAELNEHIEKVIQMYLRNEFATIADYNEQAGTIAEKYRFLVISGFPYGFSDTAAKRLLSIATSGARCGVHLLIHQDTRQPAVESALEAELRHACLRVVFRDGVFRLGGDVVEFDPAPAGEDASTLVHRIGQASVDSNRVEVPFSQISPAADARWTLETSDELRVAVGRAGAKKLQMLAIGKGTRQHVLVAGKTGSGKSTLFHVLITNLALWCSPERVEFYLVDFKKGVEFKCYADKRLPHARVVAIESDRGFALSVLQRVDAELKRRGELFRKAGSQDLGAYNRAGERSLPRTLLLIDEFQEFFTEDDSIAQQASLLLDRIVRQGRAFGIHAILGSQTLGGAYTLARATLGQMAVRVALQCNEADAHLIMDEENPAPRLLTRPGEGIYNDQSGAFAANSPFQIVWLPERERDALLDQVNELARRGGAVPQVPIVFEGNAPAEIRENAELAAALRQPPTARPVSASAWLGAPNSIKGPAAAVFKRHSGNNLLVVSQSAEQAGSLLAGAILSLAAQYPPDEAEFFILDPRVADDADESALKALAEKIPHTVRTGGPAEAAAKLATLAETLEARAPVSGKGAPEIFLIIHDLQRFKVLRPEDEFRFSYDETSPAASPSQTLAALLGEGGPCGMHVLITIDTWNNVGRWIPRKLLAEFEMRVLFQMSASDSSNLIDSPEASSLGLHRALLHNEHLGTLETFRPYSPPEEYWLEEVAASLSSVAI